MLKARHLATVGLLGPLLLGGCAPESPLPSPRTVIVYSGERLQTDGERMAEVERWLQPQLEEIETNPDFLIAVESTEEPRYPWDTLEITADTARIGVERPASDAQTPHLVYAHLRLLAGWGELHEWVPDLDEDDELAPFEEEELILRRVADVWLLGRSVYDTHAYGPLDELLYATEHGRLEDFMLATQGERFAEERESHAAGNPDWEEELQAFFREVFERDGPGYLATAESER